MYRLDTDLQGANCKKPSVRIEGMHAPPSRYFDHCQSHPGCARNKGWDQPDVLSNNFIVGMSNLAPCSDLEIRLCSSVPTRGREIMCENELKELVLADVKLGTFGLFANWLYLQKIQHPSGLTLSHRSRVYKAFEVPNN
jgi:hypothetical protein